MFLSGSQYSSSQRADASGGSCCFPSHHHDSSREVSDECRISCYRISINKKKAILWTLFRFVSSTGDLHKITLFPFFFFLLRLFLFLSFWGFLRRRRRAALLEERQQLTDEEHDQQQSQQKSCQELSSSDDRVRIVPPARSLLHAATSRDSLAQLLEIHLSSLHR